MTDIVTSLLRAVAQGSPAAPALAYGAGIVTSAGPCLAPRLASLVGIGERAPGRKRVLLNGCFIGGLMSSYALVAASTAVLPQIATASPFVYAAIAISLTWYGAKSLIGNAWHRCRQRAQADSVPSYGLAFLTGAGYAFVASPCCTPVVAAISGIAATSGSPILGTAIAAAFALGHATPLLAGSLGIARLSRIAGNLSSAPAASVVSGAVMVALGGYYALLI